MRGRVKFGGKNKAAPFPSIIAIWDGRKLAKWESQKARVVQESPSLKPSQ